MRCTRCNTKVMDNQTNCPYCGKKIGKKSAYDDDIKSDFNGVELIGSEKPTAQPPDDDPYGNDDQMPGLLKNYDEEIDFGEESESGAGVEYDFDETEKKDTDQPLFLKKESADYFHPPPNVDPDAASHFLPNRNVMTSEDYPVFPGKERIGPHKKIIAPRNTNILVGIMAVMLSLFLAIKGGAMLLNHHGFFNPDLYINYLLPLIDRVEIFFMLILVWILAFVTRPMDLKWLAIIFALVITGLYGYIFYFFYWFKG